MWTFFGLLVVAFVLWYWLRDIALKLWGIVAVLEGDKGREPVRVEPPPDDVTGSLRSDRPADRRFAPPGR